MVDSSHGFKGRRIKQKRGASVQWNYHKTSKILTTMMCPERSQERTSVARSQSLSHLIPLRTTQRIPKNLPRVRSYKALCLSKTRVEIRRLIVNRNQDWMENPNSRLQLAHLCHHLKNLIRLMSQDQLFPWCNDLIGVYLKYFKNV